MIKVSAVIITFNEERNLSRCLDSIRNIVDEIIIVDSNSTDNTAAIAVGYNATVIQHEFTGYAQQKEFATGKAANDWILSLDADEALSAGLQESIRKVKQEPEYDVYEMPRLTNYCGKWIKHCGWYPDRQTRLYNRTKGQWVDKKVHEYWQLSAGGRKGLLKGDLLHYSFSTINEHLEKIGKYSELAAREAVANGRSTNWIQIRVSPQWHFFTEYFLKLGFLDGFYGYIICRLSAYATFIKYSKIRLYSKEARGRL